MPGDRQCDRDRPFGRIELRGSGPNEAQGFARLGFGEIGERDAARARIGESDVVAAFLGEVGVELDNVAHIDDDEEDRRRLVVGKAVCVALGLQESPEHRVVPPLGAADDLVFPGSWRFLDEERKFVGFGWVFVVFLGLQDEASPFVQVDELRGPLSARLDDRHRAFELVGLRVVRTRNAQQIAQLVEE